MEYLKVIGHEALVRDRSSGAIINTNKAEYEEYMERVRAAEERETIISKHSEEINNIKNDLSEIKQYLLQIINKG